MMSEFFWPNLKALAAFLEGDRGDSERTLEHLEDELLESHQIQFFGFRRHIQTPSAHPSGHGQMY